jgi:release factor glutamine methyltransferase
MTVRDLRMDTMRRLRAAGVSNAAQEASWLIEHVLRLRPGAAQAAGARTVSAEAAVHVGRDLCRRLGGEPLQYVLGDTEFFGLELEVGPGVLIPRPETERLVELALEAYSGSGAVCDLCTGSGAVALALASRLPPATEILGVDISEAALAFAVRNRDRLGLRNAQFACGDLFAPLRAAPRFALITANPPYVSQDEYGALPPEVRDYEPREALLAGADGLEVIRRIAVDAHSWLLPDGWLLCEIGSAQGKPVRALFEAAGYREVAVLRDYAERDRVLRVQGRGDSSVMAAGGRRGNTGHGA